ncbi:MAG: CBS domain-containing protein [Myxococcales bacterium]|nr:CBS domain-containing protein [Myxococcales bacterium]
MARLQRTISEFIGERTAPIVEPTAPIAECVEQMKASGHSCVLVVEGGALVGIFTGRDFVNRVLAERRSVHETSVGEVMTGEPEQFAPSDCISYAINRMAVRGFRNLPIVEDGRVITALSVHDVIAHLSSVFAEIAELEADASEESMEEWFDTGGGG